MGKRKRKGEGSGKSFPMIGNPWRIKSFGVDSCEGLYDYQDTKA